MPTLTSRILEGLKPKRRWFQFSLRSLLELTALCAFLLAWYLPWRPEMIRPGDSLHISATGTLMDQPIDQIYTVEYDGNVLLGPAYGRVEVGGMTAIEAETKILKHLEKILARPEVATRLIGRGNDKLRETEISILEEENRRLRRQLDALLDKLERLPGSHQ